MKTSQVDGFGGFFNWGLFAIQRVDLGEHFSLKTGLGCVWGSERDVLTLEPMKLKFESEKRPETIPDSYISYLIL